MGVVTVSTTIDDKGKAEQLARSAVGARLAACAQVGAPITSVYWRQGDVEQAVEFPVVFKTTPELADALVAHVVAEHSYDVPEVLVAPVTGGHRAYLDWVAEQTTPPST